MRRVVGVTFSGSLAPGSLVIQAVTRFHLSHVTADLDDGTVIDASFARGVARRVIAYPDRSWQQRYILDWGQAAQVALYRLLQVEVGRGYDIPGALGVPVGGRWDDRDRWFCSELIGAAASILGKLDLDRREIHRLPPKKLLSNLKNIERIS